MQIDSLKDRIKDVREMVLKHCPEHIGLIPAEDSISRDKMKGITITSDSCSTACLTRTLMIKSLNGEADEMDRMSHARCTIARGAVVKALSKRIIAILINKLEDVHVGLLMHMGRSLPSQATTHLGMERRWLNTYARISQASPSSQYPHIWAVGWMQSTTWYLQST